MEREKENYIVYLNDKAKTELNQIMEYLFVSGYGEVLEGFIDELDIIINRLSDCQELHTIQVKNYRRTLFKRFDYSVYYYISEENHTVIITSIVHQKRHPKAWK